MLWGSWELRHDCLGGHSDLLVVKNRLMSNVRRVAEMPPEWEDDGVGDRHRIAMAMAKVKAQLMQIPSRLLMPLVELAPMVVYNVHAARRRDLTSPGRKIPLLPASDSLSLEASTFRLS